MKPEPTEPRPGQESVWDYPRPPKVERVSKHLQVIYAGLTIADTRDARRVLETSHPPVYYIPESDIRMECLSKASGTSLCEWKGSAVYYDVLVGDRVAARAAWGYPDPTPAFSDIKGCIAFYPELMDACYVDGEKARPQPGGFYGGWITNDIVGPFKGDPGTQSW
jgi:uncharacterized protein (DUF427 family)